MAKFKENRKWKLFIIVGTRPEIMCKTILLFLFTVVCVNCSSFKTITYNESFTDRDSLTIREGFVSQTAQRIKYRYNSKTQAIIELSEPVMVAMAEREEEWGYFQFPNIGRAKDGTLIISWQMNKDSHKVSGVDASRTYRPMMSKDGGFTWEPQDKSHFAMERGYNVLKSDGRFIEAFTPESKK